MRRILLIGAAKIDYLTDRGTFLLIYTDRGTKVPLYVNFRIAPISMHFGVILSDL